MEKRCDTCKWWSNNGPNTINWCKFPLPIWLIRETHCEGSTASLVKGEDGDNCSTWEERP